MVVGYDYAAKDANQFVKDMTKLNGKKAKSLIGLLQGPLDYTARVKNPDVFGAAAPNLILPYAIGAVMKNGKLKALAIVAGAVGLAVSSTTRLDSSCRSPPGTKPRRPLCCWSSSRCAWRST